MNDSFYCLGGWKAVPIGLAMLLPSPYLGTRATVLEDAKPVTSISRWYLKMKSEIMPYAYSIAKELVDGLPMKRAMLLEYPNAYMLGKSTQYQFLYGSYFLVTPIYLKNGAIIPMTSPNNNVNETDKNLRIYELYPYGQSAFTELTMTAPSKNIVPERV